MGRERQEGGEEKEKTLRQLVKFKTTAGSRQQASWTGPTQCVGKVYSVCAFELGAETITTATWRRATRCWPQYYAL